MSRNSGEGVDRIVPMLYTVFEGERVKGGAEHLLRCGWRLLF